MTPPARLPGQAHRLEPPDRGAASDLYAEHRKVKRVEAQIATHFKPLSTRDRADILKRIRNEYDEALRRENLLTADYASQRGIVTGEGGKAIQYNILKREVESNRQLYDAMLQQLNQSSSGLRASRLQYPRRGPGQASQAALQTRHSRSAPGSACLSGLFWVPPLSSCRSAPTAASRSRARARSI